jgi:molybdopterin synthase catalytic subunit
VNPSLPGRRDSGVTRQSIFLEKMMDARVKLAHDGAAAMHYITSMTGNPLTTPATVRLQPEPFDASAEAAKLTRGRTDVGAVVTFTGICRGSEGDEPIAALTLEHYPDMAEAEIARHVEEACSRWPLFGVTVIHRYGRITPGEDIVLVVTTSSHREAAFAAAEFLMDYLKTRAPFWKQVEKASGRTISRTWVEAKATDDAAAARWTSERRNHAAE